jgi:hypothetical protein
LLEYLAPRTGRPIPVDTQANDDWYWQVNTTASVAGRTQQIVRDPDGHALLLRDASSVEGELP